MAEIRLEALCRRVSNADEALLSQVSRGQTMLVNQGERLALVHELLQKVQISIAALTLRLERLEIGPVSA